MRPQTLLVVVLALAFGGVAAAGVMLFSGGNSPDGGPRATILIAATNVPRGETITAEAVVAREYPKDLIPEGVLTKPSEAIGRPALAPLFKDEPVLDAKLAPKGAGRGLAPLIKKGMRAISIPTPNVAAGVAGFIVPGSHVDILWTPQDASRDSGDSGPGATLLEDVEILAVDEKIDAPVAGAKTETTPMKSVTVQVKPEEAARIAPALSRGTLHLSLRNPGDDSRVPSRPAPAIVAAPKRAAAVGPPPAPPAPPAPRTIKTFRGTREGYVRLEAPVRAADAR